MMKLKRTIAALVALAVIAACAASLALTGDVDGDGAIGVKDAVLCAGPLRMAVRARTTCSAWMLMLMGGSPWQICLYLPRYNEQQRGFPARCAERRIQQRC
ncbi:MAG: hypothetical protein V8Q85_04090 [Christensenellales bacterium]